METIDQDQIEKEEKAEYRIIEESLLTSNKLPLSKDDFEKFFSPYLLQIPKISGTCYILSAIASFAFSPHFELFIRSSFSRKEDGSWTVRVPFFSGNFEEIHISQKEIAFINLNSVKNGRFNLVPWVSAAGREGIRVLEAVYIKKKFGTVDRSAAKGGSSQEVFDYFFGDLVEYHQFNPCEDLIHNPFVPQSLRSNPDIDNFFYEHGEDFIATVSDGFNPQEGILKIAEYIRNFLPVIPVFRGNLPPMLLAPNHVCCVAWYDKKSKVVDIRDPLLTTKLPLLHTLNELKGKFGSLDAVTVKKDAFLERLKAQN
jgi:hypothetical protein